MGALAWLIQRVTGVVLLAGLGIHFYLMHFMGPEAITHRAIAGRLSEPFWVFFNGAFLLSAVYHGFNGLWGMALEYVRSDGWLRASKAAILASAFALTGVGFYILGAA